MPLGGVIFIAVFVAVFGIVILYAASQFGARKHDAVKLESYECGIIVQEKKDTKISVKFYLTAILFVLFDIEIIFMYPWAVTFKDFTKTGDGGYVLVSMAVFLAVFIYGLLWEIKSKALEWE